MENQLFINHQYRVISNDENYCFNNLEYFTNGYLAMYPLEIDELEYYLNEGYSAITPYIIPRKELAKTATLEEKLNWTYEMNQMLISYGELPVSPAGMVIGEEYTLIK